MVIFAASLLAVGAVSIGAIAVGAAHRISNGHAWWAFDPDNED